MKLFRTSNIEIVTYCQEFFRCDLPSVILQKRYAKFIDNNEQNMRTVMSCYMYFYDTELR